MTDTAATSTSTSTKRRIGVRSIAALLALILGLVLLPLGTVTYWGHRTVTDSERYLETVQPLAYDEDVQDSVSTFLTDKIEEQSQQLPAAPATAPLTPQPAITIPANATSISISKDGIVSVSTPGSTKLDQVGQIEAGHAVHRLMLVGQPDDGDEHQHTAGQGVEEEFDRRAAPAGCHCCSSAALI